MDSLEIANERQLHHRPRLRERTAERIFPSNEVSAVFGNDNARELIEGPIESVF